MAVFSLKQLLEAGGIFRISRTSDARPYGSDEVRMGTNLSVSFADSSPWQGEPWVWHGRGCCRRDEHRPRNTAG